MHFSICTFPMPKENSSLPRRGPKGFFSSVYSLMCSIVCENIVFRYGRIFIMLLLVIFKQCGENTARILTATTEDEVVCHMNYILTS